MNKKYSVNEAFFDKFNQNSAYLLGFIAADGNITLDEYNRPARLSIGLSTKDIAFLEKVKILLDFSGPIITRKQILKTNNKEYSCSLLRINSRKLCQKIYDLGIKNKKSLTIKWLKNIPKKYIHHFVRGYFDGDGSICQRTDKTKNPAIEILGTFNFISNIRKEFSKNTLTKPRSIRKRNKIYLLYINGFPGCKSFKNWIYTNATIFLDRKKNKFDIIYS